MLSIELVLKGEAAVAMMNSNESLLRIIWKEISGLLACSV